MKLNYLAGSIASATFHPEVITAITPYKKGATDDTHFYGLIEYRKGYLDQNRRIIRSCIVEVSSELRKDLDQGYWPGGINAKFIQQANHSWLVAFEANSILASAYIRMADEDVQRLVSAGMGTEV